MKAKESGGIVVLKHECCIPAGAEGILAQEVPKYGDENAPDENCLWIGTHYRLSIEEVRELTVRLEHWLEHGRLAVD